MFPGRTPPYLQDPQCFPTYILNVIFPPNARVVNKRKFGQRAISKHMANPPIEFEMFAQWTYRLSYFDALQGGLAM